MSRIRWLLTALSFVATIGVSIYVVAASWPEARGRVSLPPGVHALALGAALLELLARIVKLDLSARALGIPLSFRGAARTLMGGDFGASITPSRSGSEPARFFILTRERVPGAQVVVLLFVELFLEMLSLALVAIGLVILFPGGGAALAGIVGVVGGWAAFVVGVGVAGIVLSRRNASGPPPGWAEAIGLHAGRWRAVQRSLRKVRSGVRTVRGLDKGTAALALGASVLHVVFKLLVLPALVLPLAPETPLAPLVLWPLALFYGSVVAPAPGGGGFVEVAFKATLGGALPRTLFAPALIWWRFYTFYIYILIGGVAAGRLVLRALREKDDVREGRMVA